MTNQGSSQSSRLFYRFLMMLVFPSLLYGALALGVLVTHMNSKGGFFGSALITLLFTMIAVLSNVAAGFLIVRRVPGNVVGPLLILCGPGMAGWLIPPDVQVAIETIIRPFFAILVFWAIFCLIVFFPTGRAYFRRSEWLVIAVAMSYVVGSYLGFLGAPMSVAFGSALSQANPLFIPALAPLQRLPEMSGLSLLVLLFFGAVSVIPRYRSSTLHERQQMKWIALGSAVFIVGLIAFAALGTESPAGRLYAGVFVTWAYLFPAISIGGAILRYRLYDIDVIIRRTLIYSVLTAILAAVYFGGVVLAQQVFRAVTGQSSHLAIVVSTLAIAVLFTPLRRCIQNVIDRCLYRRKYDAVKTLEAFNRTLRDEVDIETLKAQLIGVVQETMQPTSVALWISPLQPNQSIKETK